MNKHKLGFTLVEVSLFLAISTLLFIGLIAGLNSSMEAQRFNDSTQNFAEFMRSIYSQVSNVQSVGNGRSDYAIYGKLVSFGQDKRLNDEDVVGQEIFVYDIIGPASISGGETVTNKMSVFKLEKNSVGNLSSVELAGQVQSYSPRWGATIENTSRNGSKDYSPYAGTIAVIRQPQSGTITTLISDDTIQVNSIYNQALSDLNSNSEQVQEPLSWYGTFEQKAVNFCVSPAEAGVPYNMRRNVRIVAGARNASGVEIIDMDSTDNKCN